MNGDKALTRGFWSGIVATGPMTLALLNIFQKLPWKDQTPLPPSVLTQSIEKNLNLQLSDEAHQQLTWASHFAYGAAAGMVYSKALDRSQAHWFLKGSFFGFSVWFLSYKGWIPALNLHPQARNMSRRRNAMMIAAHLVWGACLAYSNEKYKTSSEVPFQKTRILN